MKQRAIVIGAGIAGISAAIRLKAKGFEVEVFEANAYPGGKLSEFKQGTYRFDAGPSLFTMPHFVDELFELMGEKPSAHFEYAVAVDRDKADVLTTFKYIEEELNKR